MARGPRQVIQGSVVLDSQGLSLLIDEDQRMLLRIRQARAESFQVSVSAITLVEAPCAGARRQRRDFLMSRLHIEPVTSDVTLLAAHILVQAGMTGHRHAIDAVVAATAVREPRPVLLYTSDPNDMAALCAEPDRPKGDRVAIIGV